MQIRSMTARVVLCAAVIGLGAVASGPIQNLDRPAIAQTLPVPMSHSSPLVGIVRGQRAHLTLAHPGRAGTCAATLAFIDHQGQVLKQEEVRLGPSEGTFVALDWREAPTAHRGRLHYRAVFTPTEGCEGAVAGHEMVENSTHKTTVFIGVYLD